MAILDIFTRMGMRIGRRSESESPKVETPTEIPAENKEIHPPIKMNYPKNTPETPTGENKG